LIATKEHDYEKSIVFLQRIIDVYYEDILADNALFTLASIEQFKFNNESKAKDLYEKLLTEYPGSLFIVEARKRFRKLRGDQIN